MNQLRLLFVAFLSINNFSYAQSNQTTRYPKYVLESDIYKLLVKNPQYDLKFRVNYNDQIYEGTYSPGREGYVFEPTGTIYRCLCTEFKFIYFDPYLNRRVESFIVFKQGNNEVSVDMKIPNDNGIGTNTYKIDRISDKNDNRLAGSNPNYSNCNYVYGSLDIIKIKTIPNCPTPKICHGEVMDCDGYSGKVACLSKDQDCPSAKDCLLEKETTFEKVASVLQNNVETKSDNNKNAGANQ